MNSRLTVALLLSLASLAPAFAQYPPPPPQINVSGSAEVKVAPDEIYISAGVETRHETLAAAKRENDLRTASALAFLKASGINEKDVQTDYISIEPSYDSDYSRTKPVIYTARKSIQIKLTVVTNFESTLTGLLTNGVNRVHGVDFRTSQLRKHRDRARAMAVQAAKEKADALAAELGVKRGKVYNINANEWGGWWSSGTYWGGRGGGGFQNVAQNLGGAGDGTGETLSIGQISVSATVNVAFLIE